MLRGLLMRRQSSQVSSGPGNANANASMSFDEDSLMSTSSPNLISPMDETLSPSSSLPLPGSANGSGEGKKEPIYGPTGDDVGDEVRFSVELTRLDRLNDTYSLDIRRLKGNLRSYKFLYDSVRT
jgi:protein-serine/threonine kinase